MKVKAVIFSNISGQSVALLDTSLLNESEKQHLIANNDVVLVATRLAVKPGIVGGVLVTGKEKNGVKTRFTLIGTQVTVVYE